MRELFLTNPDRDFYMGEIGSIKYAFIYGSFAKARENYLSDIDLLVIGSPDEDKLIKELDRLEGKLQREINYKLYTSVGFKKDRRKRALSSGDFKR